MMEDEYNLQDSIKPKKDLLSKLEDMEDERYTNDYGYSTDSFLPSSTFKKKNKKEKDTGSDSWFNDILVFSDVKVDKRSGKKKNKKLFSFESYSEYDENGKKKKKKKKKDKEKLVDYRKEFENEAALYKALLVDQSKFTDSLQKEYDLIKSTKSSARGINKITSELIENINSARSLSMQLVDKQVNIKKHIADLSMKQRKELGTGAMDESNLAEFGSSYMKQILDNRHLFNDGSGNITVNDMNDDDILDGISISLDNIQEGDFVNTARGSETDKYLKYEGSGVRVLVVIKDDDVENYHFRAVDGNGDIIDDYPLPYKSAISVNRSTDVATDGYGVKYDIVWE